MEVFSTLSAACTKQSAIILTRTSMDGSVRHHPSHFPVPTKALTLNIKGNKTDIVLCSYDDHFLVIVTQIGSMGTILHARKEGVALTNQTFNVSVIFGKRDEPLLLACARQLIQHISDCGSSRPLILSLGLKDHSLESNLSEGREVMVNLIVGSPKLLLEKLIFVPADVFPKGDGTAVGFTVETKPNPV